jgi:type IV pilus assembly protein PilM
MAKKLNSVLGVDIGSQKIKVCEIRSQGKEPVITALGIADTPEGAVDHTGVYNPEAVGAALKQLLSSSGATVGAAVVSIAGQASVLVRTLEVPKMTPPELKEHMQWEINRNIPFAESTIVSDFKPLGGDDPNSPNMDVVMAIAPQSAIDTMIQCIRKAGRNVAAIDVEPLSIARAIKFGYNGELENKTVCVVDIGHTTTSINIYFGDKLLMPRQVPVGGELFTRAMADALTCPLTEAEQIKRDELTIPESAGSAPVVSDPFGMGALGNDFQPYNPFGDDMGGAPADAGAAPEMGAYAPEPTQGFEAQPSDGTFDPTGFGTPDDATMMPGNDGLEPMGGNVPATVDDSADNRYFQAIAPVLEELVSEIRRSIDYYRSRGGDVDIVEICGGGAKIKGLAGYLERSLGIPCDTFDPMRRLNINARKVPQALVDEHREEFAVAVGNGLHIFFD